MTRPPKKPARRAKGKAKFSKIAAATCDAFLAQKKRGEKPEPDKLTPLQRRMMSGGA